jgi:hypothetical protein
LSPLAFGVQPSRGNQTGHCWAAYYNPTTRLWHSAQVGRRDRTWWWFNIDRVAVNSWAATAVRAHDDRLLPFPLFFRREVEGRQVKQLTQGGIATEELRRWMLTPCW